MFKNRPFCAVATAVKQSVMQEIIIRIMRDGMT